MDGATAVAVVISAIGGGAGLSAVLTTIFSYRKYRAEAKEQQITNEKNLMEYVTKTMKDVNEETKKLNEETKKQVAELREENSKLIKKVDVLNNKLSSLMNWIVGDDHRYRSWLEKRLHELDPDIEFPDLPDPPNVFDEEFYYDPKDRDFKTHPPSSEEEADK